MKTSDFYYDLPQELIAQDPLEDRSSSRLMHLSLKDGSIEHRHFTDVLDYMEEGDCLVIRGFPLSRFGGTDDRNDDEYADADQGSRHDSCRETGSV